MNSERDPGLVGEALPSVAADVRWIGTVGLGYFLAVLLAFKFPGAKDVVAGFWPPAGISLAALLLSRRGQWPALTGAIFLAGMIGNLLGGRSALISLGMMVANVCEPLGGAFFITHWCGNAVTFSRVREVAALVFTATVMNAGTACIGAGTAFFSGLAPFWEFWATWVVADGLGMLVFAPLIISWSQPLEPDHRRGGWLFLEGAALLGVFGLMSYAAFHPGYTGNLLSPRPYQLIPLLAWPALRFGLRGTTGAFLVLGVLTLTSSAVATGPLIFGGNSPAGRLLLAQIYLGFAGITGYLLAASWAEAREAEQAARAAEQAAREGHLRLQTLGDNIPDGMIYQGVRETDGSMRFLHVSARCLEMNQVSPEEVLADPARLFSLIHPEDLPRLTAATAASIEGMHPMDCVVRMVLPDGQTRWMRLSSSNHRLPDGRVIWSGIQMDVTSLVQAEENSRKALAEKETLLRELYHRTKNNMQVVRSFLTLQSSRSEDPRVVAALKETIGRIQTMALVHQMLYQSKDLSRVDLREYFTELIRLLQRSHRTPGRQIRIEMEVDRELVSIDSAVPAGLVLNELVTNAMQHAFPNRAEGGIRLRLTRIDPEFLELVFTDDGVGVSPDFDFRTQSSLGIQTIVGLTEHQLHGKADFQGSPGVTWRLRWADRPALPRV